MHINVKKKTEKKAFSIDLMAPETSLLIMLN